MNAQDQVDRLPGALFERMALVGAQVASVWQRGFGGGGRCPERADACRMHRQLQERGGHSRRAGDRAPYPRALSPVGPLAGGTVAAEAAAARSSQNTVPDLAQGQLWKVNGAYVEIVGLDQHLVHYRVLRQKGQKALTRVLKRAALESYLRENAAVLG